MLSLLSRVGGQTENSIKSAATESLTEIRLTGKLGVRKNVHEIDQWRKWEEMKMEKDRSVPKYHRD